MTIGDALEVVFHMAEESMEQEMDTSVRIARQEALDMVEDFIVNNFGEEDEECDSKSTPS
jgi:hypothetical protein